MRLGTEFPPLPSNVPCRVACLLVALATAGTGVEARAQANPAFGDSGWVAPLPPGTFDGDPTAPGPRVSDEVGEPVGETVLRTPFRILFLPLRLVARGAEAIAGVAGAGVVPRSLHDQKSPGLKIRPAVLYAGESDPAFGIRVVSVLDPAHQTQWSTAGSWSLRDSRKAQLAYRRGTVDDRWGVLAITNYNYRPFRSYYGVGNSTSKADKSIYLDEVGVADVALRLGRVGRSLQLLGGYDVTSARRGYNGSSPGVLEVFSPAEAPGIDDASQAFSYGLGGDLALVADRSDPTSGVHGRFEARKVNAQGGGDFNLWQFKLEARGYVPVASKRRVIALRALHHSVDPVRDDAVIPFYRLPEAAGLTNFAGFSSHRFVDRHLVLAHAEYRWLIADRLWALGLAEVGEVASSASRLRMSDVHESYGGGLRYALREGAVARLQVATGTDGFRAAVTLNGDF